MVPSKCVIQNLFDVGECAGDGETDADVTVGDVRLYFVGEVRPIRLPDCLIPSVAGEHDAHFGDMLEAKCLGAYGGQDGDVGFLRRLLCSEGERETDEEQNETRTLRHVRLRPRR